MFDAQHLKKTNAIEKAIKHYNGQNLKGIRFITFSSRNRALLN